MFSSANIQPYTHWVYLGWEQRHRHRDTAKYPKIDTQFMCSTPQQTSASPIRLHMQIHCHRDCDHDIQIDSHCEELFQGQDSPPEKM